MKKTTIIFDFDGTLADTLMIIFRIMNELAPDFGVPLIDKAKLETYRNQSLRDLLKTFKIPLIKVPFMLLQGQKRLREEINTIQTFQNLKESLQELRSRGYSLGIITSNSADIAEQFVKNHDMELFDFIFGEKNIFGKHKLIEKVIRQRNLSKEEVIYVGDEVRDIDACKKVGIDIISVTWGFNTKELLQQHSPTFVIDKPEQFLQIL